MRNKGNSIFGYEREYHLYAHKHFLDRMMYLIKSYIAKELYLDPIIKKYLKNSTKLRILDYGCGFGYNIYAFRDIADGYDISNFALSIAEKFGINVIKNEKRIPNNSYDIVLMSHVLEHVTCPYQTLKIVRKKLKRGGILILVLPFEKDDKPYKPPIELDPNQHLYAWTFRTINNLLIKADFEVLENKIIYLRGIVRFKKIYEINRKLYLKLIKLIGRILNSKEMLIICKKPSH